MTDYWRFGPIERVCIALALWIQWTLFGYVLLAVVDAHGDNPSASFPQTFELAYWLFTLCFASILILPALRATAANAPKAYRRIKTTLTQ